MDLDPNGNNFIMVDSTGASTSYGSYNRLVIEIARQLAAELPSIAIKVPPRSYYLALTRLAPRSYLALTRLARQTGKSKVTTTLAETDASGIEVALSNMEAGTPVLLLDLTKRPVMPAPAPGPAAEAEAPSSQGRAAAKQAGATTVHPLGESAGPAVRRRQIEWYREQVEKEESRRVKEGMTDYDWDVCMIAHFHDGAPTQLKPAHRTHARMPRHALHTYVSARVVRGTVLLDDGDYQSSETPTTKTSLRTREKLWQAIERVKVGYLLVNDVETPRATAEQARVRVPHVAAGLRSSPSQAPCYALPAGRRCGRVACRDGPAGGLDEWQV